MLNLAAHYNSPDRSTKSTPSGLNALRQLVNTGFQVLFHSPPGVLFTFPSRYCSTIGRQFVFSLGRWSSRLPTGFHVPRGTLDPGHSAGLSHTGLLPSSVGAFHPLILLGPLRSRRSATPRPGFRPGTVWTNPRSLAATCGITVVFFSCGYLDVSVPHVSPPCAMDSLMAIRAFAPDGFPHSDTRGSMAICASPRLFAAYRVLLRQLAPRHPPCALISLTSLSEFLGAPALATRPPLLFIVIEDYF